MSLIKKARRSLVMLAAMAIVCACTAPSDASKVQVEQAEGSQTAASGAVVGTDPGIAAPTAEVAASEEAGSIPTDASAAADAQAAGNPQDESSAAADVDQQIESLLGNARLYREVFDQLQQAVKVDDRKTVAGLVDYPLVIKEKGRPKKAIRNADAFVAEWDSIMTKEVRKAVLDQKYAGLSINQYGAMLGSGQVWINGICLDNQCAKTNVRISAINPDAL